jgi:pimeloyl-ACP methyl ester carboxylesterase
MKVLMAPMIETREIETAPGLVFDCSVSGDASAPLVLMLHGFCVSRYFWDNQIPVLAAAGYFAVAPNQRGYAAAARPDPTDFGNYRIDKLIGDALASATAAGGSISSAMIGAAASPGSLPIAGRSGSRHSPCCRDPIPHPSRAP